MTASLAGIGFDAHRFGEQPPVKLGGVIVAGDRGVVATSDGDVVAHALADALLGAAAQGDLGEHFPSDDPRWENADSMDLLEDVVRLLNAWSLFVHNADVTILAEDLRVAPFRSQIRESLAAVLGVEPGRVSVKATSTDGLGFIGRGEGLAALAVVTVTI
jgi:2-C-methyl-D-erythritol 2,4-cyclodiphosphate synthase